MSASCKPASCWIYAYRAINIVPFGILVRYLFYRIVELSVTQRVVVLFNVNFDCDLLFKLLSFYLLLFWLYDLSSMSILTTVCRKSLKNITKRNSSRVSIIDTTHILWNGRASVRPSVCLSVCLSHRLIAAAACGGFAAEHHAVRRYRSTAPQRDAQQQMRTVSRLQPP